jgi:hypothetical protein
MTDARRTDDELVSAVFDGEATAEERSRVAADPLLTERLAEFGAVADQVGGPVEPVDDAIRDQAIARALTAADGPSAGSDAEVVGIAGARDRRRLEFSRRTLLAAAAVVGALTLAGGLLSLGDGDGDSDSAQDQAAGTGDDSAEVATGGVAVPELDLGDIDDPETLRLRINEITGLGGEDLADADALAESEAGGAPEASDQPPADATVSPPSTRVDEGNARPRRNVEDCTIELIESRPELIGQLAQGSVAYQGVDAYVFAYNDADLGGAVGIVTSTADCTVLVEVPL